MTHNYCVDIHHSLFSIFFVYNGVLAIMATLTIIFPKNHCSIINTHYISDTHCSKFSTNNFQKLQIPGKCLPTIKAKVFVCAYSSKRIFFLQWQARAFHVTKNASSLCGWLWHACLQNLASYPAPGDG